MFDPLPLPEEMADWDRISMDHYGMLPEILMENACREAFSVMESEYPRLEGAKACILAGPGNNGGDAFGLARYLAQAGAETSVWRTGQPDAYKEAAAYHLRLAEAMGIKTFLLNSVDDCMAIQPDILIDGLLGTGFQGPLRGIFPALIAAVNRLKNVFILSIDIPSGLNGRTGRAEPVAVKAQATVTFQAAKVGLVMPGAAEFTGRLHVRPIGIPRQVELEKPATCRFMTRQGAEKLLPRLSPDAHKGKSGHTLIIGGSRALAGAPLLSALGALRSGAGLVTLACPDLLAGQLRSAYPEIMILPLASGDSWSNEMIEPLLDAAKQADMVVIGPGLGREQSSGLFLSEFLASLGDRNYPLLLDADALYWLARDRNLQSRLTVNDVITPHPGEMARIFNDSTVAVQARRLDFASRAAAEIGVVCVLKGAGTIVAEPDGHMYLSPFSAPNLAVGGSGDVLSGVIASLRGQGLSSVEAACLGVYWHGLCGQYLASMFPARGNLAGEIAHNLPHCWQNKPLTTYQWNC